MKNATQRKIVRIVEHYDDGAFQEFFPGGPIEWLTSHESTLAAVVPDSAYHPVRGDDADRLDRVDRKTMVLNEQAAAELRAAKRVAAKLKKAADTAARSDALIKADAEQRKIPVTPIVDAIVRLLKSKPKVEFKIKDVWEALPEYHESMTRKSFGSLMWKYAMHSECSQVPVWKTDEGIYFYEKT